jgi:hypothetical protein
MKKQTIEQQYGRLYGHFRASLDLHSEMLKLIARIEDYQASHDAPECPDLDAAINRAYGAWEEFENCHDEDMELTACALRCEILAERKRLREEYWRKQDEKRLAKQKKAKPKTQKLANAA